MPRADTRFSSKNTEKKRSNIFSLNLYTMIMKNSRVEFFLKLAAITAAAFIVFNFGVVGGFFGNVFKILQPVLIGIVLALAMSVPLRFFERKVFSKITKPRLKEFLCLSVTFLIFGGVITVLAVLIIPQGVKSVKDLMEKFSSGEVSAAVGSLGGMDLQPVIEKVYNFLTERISEYLPKIMSVMQTVFTGLYNVLFGVVIAIMLVINRKNVKEQLKKAIGLVFKERNIKVHSFLINASEKFSRYLGGQLTEACILGFACYVTMLVLKVPYAALVSLIIGFMNLIPIVGAYIGGALCAVIVFAANPSKVLVLIIAIIILQQVEGFTTYPVIVGKYVGLNGFWITVSIIIWGGIFGFWGMFLGVPLSAFLFDLFDNYHAKKSAEMKILRSLKEK